MWKQNYDPEWGNNRLADKECKAAGARIPSARTPAGEKNLAGIHLFPYGYFQHAKLVQNSGDETLRIRFQDCLVTVTGKNLETLCGALQQLAVDRIRLLPKTHRPFPKSEEASLKQSKLKNPKENSQRR